MKKFAKLAAVFAALMLALSCFVACSSGDDDDDATEIVGGDNAGSNGSVSKSTWTTVDGCTLTLDNGTYKFDTGDKIYTGTYTETESKNGNSAGTLEGDVAGTYSIYNGTLPNMYVSITEPFKKSFTFIIEESAEGSKPSNPSNPSNSTSKSTWSNGNGDTLTFYNDGTYKYVINDNSYTGTYTETTTAGVYVTGQLKGKIEATYTITNSTMSCQITKPLELMNTPASLTKK